MIACFIFGIASVAASWTIWLKPSTPSTSSEAFGKAVRLDNYATAGIKGGRTD
jgi:hypothetical protein